tara:strand:- start:8307 stop:9335 length:1029 start_codon:yes stop_codon:yes gene_type:complete
MTNKANIFIPKYNLDFKINKNKNIIQASLEIGIKLAFSCRSGICGTCRAKVIKGIVDNGNKINHNLSPEEKKNNIIYTCQASAKSDKLELEFLSPLSKQIYSINKPKEFILEVLSKRTIGKTFFELLTSFPKKNSIFTNDGMKVKVLIEGKISKKQYSISIPEIQNDGSNNGILTIYIPTMEKKLYNNIIPGEIITVLGPYQTKFNNFNPKLRPLLYITSNKDIVLFLSHIKKVLFYKHDQIIMLICNFDSSKNIQFMEEMHKIQNKHKNFTYKIILSKEKIKINNRFIYGTTENTLNKILSNLSNYIIYISENIDNYTKIIKKTNELGAIKKSIIILNEEY